MQLLCQAFLVLAARGLLCDGDYIVLAAALFISLSLIASGGPTLCFD